MMDLLNQIGSMDAIPTIDQMIYAGRILQRLGAVLLSVGSLIVALS